MEKEKPLSLPSADMTPGNVEGLGKTGRTAKKQKRLQFRMNWFKYLGPPVGEEG